MAEVIFWLCAVLLIYNIVGYPCLLWVVARLRPWPHRPDPAYEPMVTITIAARNEADTIAGKIDSILALEYPPEKMELIVGSDDSQDGTNEIVLGYNRPDVKLMVFPRSGKATLNNRMTEEARGEIVIDTTASGYFERDFLRNIVPHYADPAVGCVTGEVVMAAPGKSGVSQFEGAYFRYEWWLRQKETSIGLLCVSNGGLLSYRKQWYRPIGLTSDVDNMVPLMMVAQGHKVVHEPQAQTLGEPWVESYAAQKKGRTRQVTRSQQDIYRAGELLNPLRHPAQAWVLWSHRLLRWWSPIFALIMLAANLFLLDSPFYLLAFLAQIVVYGLGLVGRISPAIAAKHRLVSIAGTVLNVFQCFLVGTFHAVRGKKIVTW